MLPGVMRACQSLDEIGDLLRGFQEYSTTVDVELDWKKKNLKL